MCVCVCVCEIQRQLGLNSPLLVGLVRTSFLIEIRGLCHLEPSRLEAERKFLARHLLDRLREKIQQEDLELPDYEARGANEDSHDPDLEDAAILPSHLPKLHDPLSQAQWRQFLAASRRFSGCFGIRLDRIGTQTGLGCKSFKPRRSLFQSLAM
uniref:Uncharacterized protein n=1 Tax=Laticauda laticaudata TaxID=8630 RepID=A0A8C5WYH7_LATLA